MTDKTTLEEIERLSEGRTPGDWRIAAVGDYVGGGLNIDAVAGGYICLIDGSAEFPSEHSRADANLIAHAPRLLEICREQAGIIRADDERLEKAAIRVWGEHVMGCDTAERMADLIEHLRAQIG